MICWASLTTDRLRQLTPQDILSRTPQQLTDSAKTRCQVGSHKLSKDLLSLSSANSARICWAAASQTQQGFAEPQLHQLCKDLLSCNSTNSARICWAWLHHRYKAQRLSVEGAESVSTTDRYRAQWLSVESAESDSTGMYVQKGFGSLAEQLGLLKLVGWWAYDHCPDKRDHDSWAGQTILLLYLGSWILSSKLSSSLTRTKTTTLNCTRLTCPFP